MKIKLNNSLCSIFDLMTPLYPAYFLPLASLGNLTKVFYYSAVPLMMNTAKICMAFACFTYLNSYICPIFLVMSLPLIQAVARGLRDPSFRVIQNHFAISGNLGEVAAKV